MSSMMIAWLGGLLNLSYNRLERNNTRGKYSRYKTDVVSNGHTVNKLINGDKWQTNTPTSLNVFWADNNRAKFVRQSVQQQSRWTQTRWGRWPRVAAPGVLQSRWGGSTFGNWSAVGCVRSSIPCKISPPLWSFPCKDDITIVITIFLIITS